MHAVALQVARTARCTFLLAAIKILCIYDAILLGTALSK